MSLTGKWYNELNSEMTIKDDGKGHISGTYKSTVGDFRGVEFVLIGSYDQTAKPPATVLGWVVVWSAENADEAHSVTAWSGQYDPEQDVIAATWLLTSASGLAPQEAWSATLVGEDRFGREPRPNTKAIQTAAPRAASHPVTTPS